MTYNEIINRFPEQVRSHRPFIVEMIQKGTVAKTFTLRIAQNIQEEAKEILNNSYPRIQTCYHFNVREDMIHNLNLEIGSILENFNISVWDSTEPSYKNQKPRMFTEGPFKDQMMLYHGIPYFRHTKLVVGPPRIELWVPDQIRSQPIVLKTEEPVEEELEEDFSNLESINLDDSLLGL